ncbi:hypothetical protein CTI32_09610 [Enterococcus faecium]|nr:hypothetical protein CTI32_09610 [Enterococcus faecium]
MLAPTSVPGIFISNFLLSHLMDYITQIFLFTFYDISLCNKNTYHYFPEKEKNATDFSVAFRLYYSNQI